MKRFVLEILCVLPFLCSCIQEIADDFGRPRGTVDMWKKRDPAERVASLSDTVIYASALKYNEGYDWKTDTAHAPVSLLLMKNGVTIVEVRTKGSCGIDSHIISNGHLISWEPNEEHTVFRKDGQVLFETDCPETIKGIIETKTGEIWTLGEYAGRWMLRKNGAVCMEDEGSIVGDVLCDCCPPTGALYMDNGSMCFCYTTYGGGRKAWHFVQDGKTTQISDDGIITDIKMMGGVLNIAVFRESTGQSMLLRGNKSVKIPSYSGGQWKNMRIIQSDGKGFLITGQLLREGNTCTGLYNSSGSIASYGHPGQVANNGSKWYFIYRDEGNLVLMPYRKSKAITVEGNPYFASSRCAAYLDDELYYAVSPLPGKGKPYIMKNTGNKAFEFDFNGFITGIDIKTEESVVP